MIWRQIGKIIYSGGRWTELHLELQKGFRSINNIGVERIEYELVKARVRVTITPVLPYANVHLHCGWQDSKRCPIRPNVP